MFTPDATCANKSRYLRVVGRLNILSLLASFACEIAKMILSSIVVSAFCLRLLSILEQAPDWLTQHEYPPKFRFFNLRSIRVASFARIASFASRHSHESRHSRKSRQSRQSRQSRRVIRANRVQDVYRVFALT